MSEERPQHVIDEHRRHARVELLKARHYVLFFGQPIAEFSEQHNAERVEMNEQSIRAHAKEAGRYACFASTADEDERAMFEWETWAVANAPELADERVWEPFVESWRATRQLLEMPDDDPKPGARCVGSCGGPGDMHCPLCRAPLCFACTVEHNSTVCSKSES